MMTLREDGLRCIYDGETTIEESAEVHVSNRAAAVRGAAQFI